MRAILLLGAGALALSACAAPPPRASLDCPAKSGHLTRTSASADGKACTYASDEGVEVALRLVALTGGPEATLRTFESQLVGDRAVAEAAPASVARAAAKEAADVAAQAESDARPKAVVIDLSGRHDGVRVSEDGTVDLNGRKGVVIDTGDKGGGGTAQIDLPGIHISADEDNDSAKVKVGGVLSIDTDSDGTTTRSQRDVRLRGEQLSREKRGLRASFYSTGDKAPAGFAYVGYEAGGRKAGPLAVATIRARQEISEDGYIRKDVQKLVRRNGGV